MKKIILLLFVSFLITSCGTSGDTTNTTEYSSTGFTMNIPKTWTKVESKDLPNIQNGKIELALTASTEIAAGFANNLIILSETILEKTTSTKYAITNYVRTTGSVQEFNKLDEKNFNYSDKDEGKMYTFDAKYGTTTPKRKFVQTAKICNDKAYLMTIGINIDNTDVAKYENLLKSFKCK